MFRDELRDVLNLLEEDERFVLRLRYGLGVPRRVPVSEIAEITFQTPKWVKRTEAKALRKLRLPYQKYRLSPYSNSMTAFNLATERQELHADQGRRRRRAVEKEAE